MTDDVSGMHPSRTVEATSHGACMARRMVAGAGLAGITPYANPELGGIEVLGHRWSLARERILLVCRGPVPAGSGGPVEVRLQIEKAAALPEVRVLSASLHALGTMHLLDESDRDGDLGPFAEVAGSPGVWIGAVRAPRLLLHRSGRVEQHATQDLMAGGVFPGPADELSAVDLLLDHGELAMARLAAAVLDGRRGGESVRVNAPQTPCGHLRDRVLPIDVSAHGVTMLLTGQDGAGVITADFDLPATQLDELASAVAELFADQVAQPGTW